MLASRAQLSTATTLPTFEGTNPLAHAEGRLAKLSLLL